MVRKNNENPFWNPMKAKAVKNPFWTSPSNMNKNYSQLRKKINPFGDIDGDGIKNYKDCKPFDFTRHSKMQRKEIRATVMAPPKIYTTVRGLDSSGRPLSSKKIIYNYPSRKEIEETIKLHKQEGKSVPPKKRMRLLTQRHLIRVLEKNPDLYAKYRDTGTKIEMKPAYDAVFSDIPDEVVPLKGEYEPSNPNIKVRKLATYRPLYGIVQVNPIRDIADTSPLTTLKHEAIHLEQHSNTNFLEWGNIYQEEKEAYARMHEPTARDIAKAEGAKPEVLAQEFIDES